MKLRFSETSSLKALRPYWSDGAEREIEGDEAEYLLDTFPGNFSEVKSEKKPERTKEKRPDRNK